LHPGLGAGRPSCFIYSSEGKLMSVPMVKCGLFKGKSASASHS
jgi:hypothetical protein